MSDAIVYGTLALVALAVAVWLWPGRRNARRLLLRWGVADPTGAEVADAHTYLRRRWIWYVPLFLGGPPLVRWLSGAHLEGFWLLLGTLLFGALLAELLAQRPARRPWRVASLDRRRVRDLVPGWALGTLALAGTTVVAAGIADLLGAHLPTVVAVGDSDALSPHAGAVLVTAAAVLLLVLAVLWLSVRRPPDGQPRADAVLRIRSGRVATGLGVAALCSLVATGTTFVGFLIMMGGLIAWRAIAGATRVAGTA